MTGFYDAPVGGSPAVEAQGTDAIPETAMSGYEAAAGETLTHAFPTYDLARANVEETSEFGSVDPFTGQLVPRPDLGTMLDPAAANDKYGIEGRLKWNMPVPEGVAQEMSARKHDEIAREDIVARSGIGGVGRFAAGLVGGLPGLADPLNIAAAFLPVVPEARGALWAARAGLAGRAATGAIEGMAGQAALTPLQAMLSRHEQDDYTATDALLNIALGGVFGGGLHTLGGLGHAGERAGIELERAAPETRDALLRGSVADLAADRPVESPARVYDYIAETPGLARPYQRVPAEPERLGQFLHRQGGVADDGGELKALDLGTRGRVRGGLINDQGMPLDEAALKAWEAGYLPGAERPDINALQEALDRDHNLAPVYSDHDRFAVAQYQDALDHNAELDRLSTEHGIPLAGKTRAEFYAALQEKLGQAGSEAEAERLAQSHGQIMAQAQAEGWLPDFGEGAPTTPEEIADAYRQEKAARLARESEGGFGEPSLVGRPAGVDETSLRSGRGGLGARRSDEPGSDRASEIAAELNAAATRPAEQALAEEIAELDRAIGQAREADQLPESDAELDSADASAAQSEAFAEAIEKGGQCLGRRA